MSEKAKTVNLYAVYTDRQLAPVVPTQPIPDQEDIVTYVRKNKVKKVGNTGNTEEDYVVEEVVVEDSRVNRQAFIDKDASDVGVLNILEKVRRSGDATILNQTGSIIPEGLQDYTDVPHNVQGVLDAMQKGANSFEGLKAIFGDTSFDALANMSADDIAAKLNAYVIANMAQQKKGEAE